MITWNVRKPNWWNFWDSRVNHPSKWNKIWPNHALWAAQQWPISILMGFNHGEFTRYPRGGSVRIFVIFVNWKKNGRFFTENFFSYWELPTIVNLKKRSDTFYWYFSWICSFSVGQSRSATKIGTASKKKRRSITGKMKKKNVLAGVHYFVFEQNLP